MMGSRRKGRALALQVLYAAESQTEGSAASQTPAQAVSQYVDAFGPELSELDDEAREFANQLVGAAEARKVDIDETISKASRNWRLDRMAKVDRNILRLATAEFIGIPSTPVRVVINEAVELAKAYGAAESAAFVNGVLDRIAHGLGRTSDS